MQHDRGILGLHSFYLSLNWTSGLVREISILKVVFTGKIEAVGISEMRLAGITRSRSREMLSHESL